MRRWVLVASFGALGLAAGACLLWAVHNNQKVATLTNHLQAKTKDLEARTKDLKTKTDQINDLDSQVAELGGIRGILAEDATARIHGFDSDGFDAHLTGRAQEL